MIFFLPSSSLLLCSPFPSLFWETKIMQCHYSHKAYLSKTWRLNNFQDYFESQSVETLLFFPVLFGIRFYTDTFKTNHVTKSSWEFTLFFSDATSKKNFMFSQQVRLYISNFRYWASASFIWEETELFIRHKNIFARCAPIDQKSNISFGKKCDTSNINSE